MKCFSCGKNIERFDKKCEHCGYIFTESEYKYLTDILNIKDNIQSLKIIEKSFNKRVNEIEKSILAMEENTLKFDGETAKQKPLIKDNKSKNEDVNIKSEEDLSFNKNNIISKKHSDDKRKDEHFDTSKTSLESEFASGQKWILIIGIILMVMGVGYFLKYSFEQGWVSPVFRVILAYLWGIVFLFAGNKLYISKKNNYGLYIIGAGISVLYASSFFAYNYYSIISDTIAFFLLICITLLTAYLAVYYDRRYLSVIGVIGGFITPVMVGSNSGNHIALFSYICVLNAGILLLAYYKNWGILTRAGFICTNLLFFAWISGSYTMEKISSTLIFNNITFIIYAIIPFVYALNNRKKEIESGIIIGINTFIGFLYNYFIIQDYFDSTVYCGLISAIYTILFIVIASNISRKKEYSYFFAYFSMLSVIFSTLAIALVFSKYILTILLAIDGMACVWLGKKIDKKNIVNFGITIIAVSLLRFILHDYSFIFKYNIDRWKFNNGYTFEIISRYITLVVIAFSMFFTSKIMKETGEKNWKYYLSAGFIFSAVFLNLEVVAFLKDYLSGAALASTSILWVLYGYTMIYFGFIKNEINLRKYGKILLILAALKVFFIDLSHLDKLYRIISFILVGILFMVTSYLYYKFSGIYLNKEIDHENK